MQVIVGRTRIEEHEIAALRQGLSDRLTVLEKAKKANENASLPTRDADNEIYVCQRLTTLFDPIKSEAEEARRSQVEMFTGRPSQSVEDATADAEREAAARIRHREIVRAIGGIMSDATMSNDAIGAEWTDELLRDSLLRRFEEVEHIDELGDLTERRWPGVYALFPIEENRDASADVVWCGVDATGAVERFWYDIDPTTAWRALAPTLIGDALVPYLREAWGLEDPTEVERTRRAEVRAALLSVLPNELLPDLTDGQRATLAAHAAEPPKGAYDENEFAAYVAETLDHEAERISAGQGYDVGFFRRDVGGKRKLCYVVGGTVAALHYDVDEDFDPVMTDRDPDLNEADILAIARELYFPAAGNSAGNYDENYSENIPETPEEWARRIRPAPSPGAEITNEMVALVLHDVLLAKPEGAVMFHELRQGASDEELQGAIGALVLAGNSNGSHTHSGTVVVEAEGKEQRVPYEMRVSPLRLIVGKGKGRKVLDTDKVLVLVRGLMDIEAPEAAVSA